MSSGLPRVLVLTGTSDHPFPRLFDALPALLEQAVAGEVRVQTEAPATLPPGLVHLAHLDRAGVAREIEAADAVITHGGSGSCLEALAAGHLPIVVARRRSLHEIADDHQSDLADALEARGLAWLPTDPLPIGLAEGVRRATDRPRRPVPVFELGGVLRNAAAELARVERHASRTPVRVRRVGDAEFDAAAARLVWRSPLQSSAWGAARRVDGWRPSWWVAEDRSGRARAALQVLHHGGPALPAYVPYGPMLSDEADSADAAAALLRHLARRSLVGVLWAPAWFHRTRGLVAALRTEAVEPPSTTGLLDLSRPDTELRRSMRGTWRRDLEKAETDPAITVRLADAASGLGPLLARVTSLSQERSFAPPISADVAARLATEAAARGLPLFLVEAVADGRVVSTYAVAVTGALAQTLWTANDADPKASGGGRRALWRALQRARELGARRYDLAGIDDAGNPGVAGFKRGLGPTLEEVPGLRWLPPPWTPRPLVRAGVDRLRARLRVPATSRSDASLARRPP